MPTRRPVSDAGSTAATRLTRLLRDGSIVSMRSTKADARSAAVYSPAVSPSRNWAIEALIRAASPPRVGVSLVDTKGVPLAGNVGVEQDIAGRGPAGYDLLDDFRHQEETLFLGRRAIHQGFALVALGNRI